VPRLEQRGALAARARGTGVLLMLAIGLVISTVATGSAIAGAIGPGAEKLAAFALSLALNASAFLVVFWLLNERPLRIRELAPGVALAAVGSLGLQAIGGWYVEHAVTRASDTYGAFAVVIGMLSWFWLGGNLLLLAAEVNVVLSRRLWPRSLAGDLAPADRDALRQSARAARQDPREEILVRFGDEPPAAVALSRPDGSSRRCRP
jgi:membrane protein